MNDIQKKLVKDAGKKIDKLIDFRKLFESKGKLQIIGAGAEMVDDNIFSGILSLGFRYLADNVKKDYQDFLEAYIFEDKLAMADNLGDITAHYLNAEKIEDTIEDKFFDNLFLILIGVITKD